MATGIRELPDALAAYGRGVGGAVGRGAFSVLVFLLAFVGVGLAAFGTGVVLVLLAVAAPAVAAAVALELPRVVGERLGTA